MGSGCRQAMGGRIGVSSVVVAKPFMRKRGNPNWGRPMLPSPNVPTEFEMRAQRLRLTKETYLGSDKLRTWCKQNRNRCYIPEWLLDEWQIDVDPNISN
jgi:hypothetical protein